MPGKAKTYIGVRAENMGWNQHSQGPRQQELQERNVLTVHMVCLEYQRSLFVLVTYRRKAVCTNIDVKGQYFSRNAKSKNAVAITNPLPNTFTM